MSGFMLLHRDVARLVPAYYPDGDKYVWRSPTNLAFHALSFTVWWHMTDATSIFEVAAFLSKMADGHMPDGWQRREA